MKACWLEVKKKQWAVKRESPVSRTPGILDSLVSQTLEILNSPASGTQGIRDFLVSQTPGSHFET